MKSFITKPVVAVAAIAATWVPTGCMGPWESEPLWATSHATAPTASTSAIPAAAAGRVTPSQLWSYSSVDTPLPIPSGDPYGVDSLLQVPELIDLQSVEVDVAITHPYVGDLRITLLSPNGTEVVLRERGTGGSADDVHETYTLVTELTGEQARGQWTMHVDDNYAADLGTLERWALRLTGVASAPTFEVSLPDWEVSVAQGASAQHPLAITSPNGFAGPVAMSAASPEPFSFSFSPSVVAAPGATSLTVAVPCDQSRSSLIYPVTVAGESGGVTRTAPYPLWVRVHPFGTTAFDRASVHGPRAIPDGSPAGVLSALSFSEPYPVQEILVEPRLTHPRPSDLVIELLAPGVPASVLHHHESTLQPRYVALPFNHQQLAGEWKLRVTDTVAGVDGTFDGLRLSVLATPPPAPPVASFGVATRQLVASFTDASTDPGACGGAGIISSWRWDFGDGTTSTARHPRHRYAAPGTYAVTLTVTNGADRPAQRTQHVTVGR